MFWYLVLESNQRRRLIKTVLIPSANQAYVWGVRWDSNPQRQESQSWDLPIDLRTPLIWSGCWDSNPTCLLEMKITIYKRFLAERKAQTMF